MSLRSDNREAVRRENMKKAREAREAVVRELKKPTRRELELLDELQHLDLHRKSVRAELQAEREARRARAAAPVVAVPPEITDPWERKKFIAKHKMRQLRTRKSIEATKLAIEVALLEEAIETGRAKNDAQRERDELAAQTRERVEALRQERWLLGQVELTSQLTEKEIRFKLDADPMNVACHDKLGQLLSERSRRNLRNAEITRELREAHDFLELVSALEEGAVL